MGCGGRGSVMAKAMLGTLIVAEGGGEARLLFSPRPQPATALVVSLFSLSFQFLSFLSAFFLFYFTMLPLPTTSCGVHVAVRMHGRPA